MTINHGLASFHTRSGGHSPARGGQITHGGALDGRARRRAHALDRDAVIYDRGFIHRVIIDDRRVVIDLGDLGRLQTVVAQVALVEILYTDKRKLVRMQAEVEAGTHVNAIITPADAGLEYRVRGQRRPSTIGSV